MVESKKAPLGFCMISTDLLIKADWNYKLEDASISKKLRKNIKRIGLVQNLIIREVEDDQYEVINGNHRLDALRDNGAEKAIVFNCGEKTRIEAIRLAIETNETRFPTDEIALAKLVVQIQEKVNMDELLETMPYTEEELEDFERLLEFKWEEPIPKEKTPPKEKKIVMMHCPHCDHNFEKPK